MKRRSWTESEIEKAILLYLKTPFGRIHQRNPEIIQLAEQLDRTPGSIALKMTNIAGIDDSLDRKGMSNHSKLDRTVWDRLFGTLRESAKLLGPDPMDGTAAAQSGLSEAPQALLADASNIGRNIQTITNIRHGQQLFRKIILSSYDECCAITGMHQTEFLVAAHIRRWSEDPENRMNPRNGICLNKLHDAAFEFGYIAIDEDGKVLYSKKLRRDTLNKIQRMCETGYFRYPSRFKPSADFLKQHRDNRFLQ